MSSCTKNNKIDINDIFISNIVFPGNDGDNKIIENNDKFTK